MKSNLKNKPKLGCPYPDDTTGYNYVVYYEEMEDWFEGFKKTIAELLERIRNYPTKFIYKGTVEVWIRKEILGEIKA